MNSPLLALGLGSWFIGSSRLTELASDDQRLGYFHDTIFVRKVCRVRNEPE